MTQPKRIGFLGFDGVTALDLVGPLEAFSVAAQDEHFYEPIVIGLTARAFTAASGIVFKPHRTIDNAPSLDTIVIPGGPGLRQPATNARAAAWLAVRAPRCRRVATVCTGIYGLAPTGLLDGRRVTTHWRYARDVAAKFPKLRVDPTPLFLSDGPFYTAAGITAGIDLALALIEEDRGPAISLNVARELVVFLKRPGGQDQFSEPLHFQMQATDRFADIGAWIATHLHQEISVDDLAKRVHLSHRHFRRRFKEVFGTTPAAFVESLRLSEARRRLTARATSIKSVGTAVGYSSVDVFRKAFERRFGVAPSAYRSRFMSTTRG